MLEAISWTFFLLAVAIAIFGGGAPVGGFKKNKNLYREYKKAKKAGDKPSVDQQGAYYTVVCYVLGAWMLSLSLIFYFLYFMFEA